MGKQTSSYVKELSEPLGNMRRDDCYYYEDGNVTVLVENVLFKLHASLLKPISRVLGDVFDNSKTRPEKVSNERAVVIPEVKASEFRNFLKLFYCSPSERFDLDSQLRQGNRFDTWSRFQFCSDIARLAQDFGVADIETRAAEELAQLACDSGLNLIATARNHTPGNVLRCLLETLKYARRVRNVDLQHDLRNAIQVYCTDRRAGGIPIADLIELFHTPALRHEDWPLFGFLFITLLSYGNGVWAQTGFTRKDRAAFFSAQSYLTPLPDSLGASLNLPLLVEPQLTDRGYLEALVYKTCSNKCRRRLSSAWKKSMIPTHYIDLGKDIFKSTPALIWLATFRLDFARNVRSLPTCAGRCNHKVVAYLDRNIEQLFGELADYYQDIN
ncbi:hypothetical protein FS749_016239 [Ceratobasidium sp. UAMH 11750]|nr:hypothetical protein FS749_016239 [Ceratobasidium sp. UAMH 11750]